MTAYFYCDFINDIKNNVPAELPINNGHLRYPKFDLGDSDSVYCYLHFCGEEGGESQVMELTIELGESEHFCYNFNDPNKLEKHIKEHIKGFKRQLTEAIKEEIL